MTSRHSLDTLLEVADDVVVEPALVYRSAHARTEMWQRSVRGNKSPNDSIIQIATCPLGDGPEGVAWVNFPLSAQLKMFLAVRNNEDVLYPWPKYGGHATMEYFIVGHLHGESEADAYLRSGFDLPSKTRYIHLLPTRTV